MTITIEPAMNGRLSRALVAAALVACLAGCWSDTTFTDTKPLVLYCEQPDCPPQTCHYTWEVDTAALKQCFWDDYAGTWFSDAPTEVTGCDPSAPTCTIPAHGYVSAAPMCIWTTTYTP